MKRIICVFAAFAMLCMFARSCVFVYNANVIKGNGVSVTDTLDLGGFNSIDIFGSMDVYYTQGPQKVTLTADENLIEYYDIDVKGGELVVKVEKGVSISPKCRSFITVSSPDLNGVKITGSGDCRITEGLRNEGEFTFTVVGSGDLYADSIVCGGFTATVAGSGDVEVDALTCRTTTLSIKGSGDIEIGCKDAGDVSVNIAGSGDVRLNGTASSLSQKIAGSGDIHASGLQLSI